MFIEGKHWHRADLSFLRHPRSFSLNPFLKIRNLMKLTSIIFGTTCRSLEVKYTCSVFLSVGERAFSDVSLIIRYRKFEFRDKTSYEDTHSLSSFRDKDVDAR